MTYLTTNLYSFFLVTMFLSSCNGQVKTNLPEQQTIVSAGQPKLIKSQSSNEADNVHCILQDKEGDIWFATTRDGVYRYDGKTFINYTTKDGLNSNCVFSMLQDKAGNIWFGTNNGLSRFDGKTFSYIPISVNKTNPIVKNTINNIGVNTILQDKKGTFWLATESGVICYDGKEFSNFIDNPSIINPSKFNPKTVTNIIEDKKGNIWFTTRQEGIYRFDSSEIVNFQPDGLAWFFNIFEDNNGNIWVGNRNGDGVYQFNGKTFTNQWQNLGLNRYVIYSMIQDKAGNIWFGTEADETSKRETNGGIWCYDGTTLKNFKIKDGLDNNSIFSVFEDKIGNIWIGGRNTSLSKYDGKTFINFSE
jgi:ligand-binding sensor domain-containing protein